MSDPVTDKPAPKLPIFHPEELAWDSGEEAAWMNPETNTLRECDICRKGVGRFRYKLLEESRGGPAFVCFNCKCLHGSQPHA